MLCVVWLLLQSVQSLLQSVQYRPVNHGENDGSLASFAEVGLHHVDRRRLFSTPILGTGRREFQFHC